MTEARILFVNTRKMFLINGLDILPITGRVNDLAQYLPKIRSVLHNQAVEVVCKALMLTAAGEHLHAKCEI